MKVLLIAPASGRWHGVGRSRFFGGRVFRFSLLSLLGVAADTPPGVDVRIVDEQVQDVPLDEDFDLVGISCMTAAAPRAYALAEVFRGRGIPVVLGGMHPTLMPEEAAAHADAVCVGDAEGVWARIVEDARAGRLSGLYRAAPHGLNAVARPPRHLLQAWHYSTLQAVQATRGCPNRCAFCSVSAFHRGGFRCRPVADVAAEVASFNDRLFVFVDDNLIADRAYARDLFRALRPLRRLWMSQATLDIADDPELVRLAADSGCIGLFVGIESFSGPNLESVGKGFNKAGEYRRKVKLLHAHGIGVEAGIVFGFERDDVGVFRRTLRLLDELEIDMAQVSILTPLPGTPFHESIRARIFDRDWSHHDFHHVVFEPWRMSAEDLQAGHDWVTGRFYSPWRIARRLVRMALRPRGWRALPYAAAINLGYYGRTVRWRLRGWDPGARASRGDLAGGEIGRALQPPGRRIRARRAGARSGGPHEKGGGHGHDSESSAVDLLGPEAPGPRLCRVHQRLRPRRLRREPGLRGDGPGPHDAPDPHGRHPGGAGRRLATGVDRSGPVHGPRDPACRRDVLGPLPLDSVRGGLRPAHPDRRPVPDRLAPQGWTRSRVVRGPSV